MDLVLFGLLVLNLFFVFLRVEDPTSGTYMNALAVVAVAGTLAYRAQIARKIAGLP